MPVSLPQQTEALRGQGICLVLWVGGSSTERSTVSWTCSGAIRENTVSLVLVLRGTRKKEGEPGGRQGQWRVARMRQRQADLELEGPLEIRDVQWGSPWIHSGKLRLEMGRVCLLYTSDAADDWLVV